MEEGEKVATVLLARKGRTEFRTIEKTAPADGFLIPLVGSENPPTLRRGDPIGLISDRLQFLGGVDYEVVMPEDNWLGNVTPLEKHAKFRSALKEGLVDSEEGTSEEVIWGHLERNGRKIKDLHREYIRSRGCLLLS